LKKNQIGDQVFINDFLLECMPFAARIFPAAAFESLSFFCCLFHREGGFYFLLNNLYLQHMLNHFQAEGLYFCRPLQGSESAESGSQDVVDVSLFISKIPHLN